ncbi:hypothetical protein CLV51_105346 [Chitinophaga niastensis]|uniref:Uncharacterized protein n=1 Tax=Chitinophaga niastensis TaxID=536980 RepID=A0A2P8HFK0_CHINA|nr:hypothetical protein [Chitinophaga niastensis]PSL44971.1 hypothetical protein CLV51_105346 [Chitinophaga niastensis]
MYPSFITFISSDSDGTKLLRICDQEFKVFDYDWYIEDAINLAKYWKAHQVTYQRIVCLRTWIRENYQHGHDIPYKHMRSLQACRHWVESVIHAEYECADEMFQESYKRKLVENKAIFSKRETG